MTSVLKISCAARHYWQIAPRVSRTVEDVPALCPAEDEEVTALQPHLTTSLSDHNTNEVHL